MPDFDVLPNELLHAIFEFMDAETLLNMRATSQQLRLDVDDYVGRLRNRGELYDPNGNEIAKDPTAILNGIAGGSLLRRGRNDGAIEFAEDLNRLSQQDESHELIQRFATSVRIRITRRTEPEFTEQVFGGIRSLLQADRFISEGMREINPNTDPSTILEGIAGGRIFLT